MNNFYYLLIIIFIILFIFYIYINNINIELFFTEDVALPAPDLGPIIFVDFDKPDIELGKYPSNWTDAQASDLEPTIIKIKRGRQGPAGDGGGDGKSAKCTGTIKIDSIESNELEFKGAEFKINSDKIQFNNELCFGEREDDGSNCLNRDLIGQIKNHTTQANRLATLEKAIDGPNKTYVTLAVRDGLESQKIKCEEDLREKEDLLTAAQDLIYQADEDIRDSIYMQRAIHKTAIERGEEEAAAALTRAQNAKERMKVPCDNPLWEDSYGNRYSCHSGNNLFKCSADLTSSEAALENLLDSICQHPDSCDCGPGKNVPCDEKYVKKSYYDEKVDEINALRAAATTDNTLMLGMVKRGEAEFDDLSVQNKNKYCRKYDPWSLDTTGECVFDDLSDYKKNESRNGYGEIGTTNGKYGQIGAYTNQYLKQSECDAAKKNAVDDALTDYGEIGPAPSQYIQNLQCNSQCAIDKGTEWERGVDDGRDQWRDLAKDNGYGKICDITNYNVNTGCGCIPYDDYDELAKAETLDNISSINLNSKQNDLKITGDSLTFYGNKLVFEDNAELCIGGGENDCVFEEKQALRAFFQRPEVGADGQDGTCSVPE